MNLVKDRLKEIAKKMGIFQIIPKTIRTLLKIREKRRISSKYTEKTKSINESLRNMQFYPRTAKKMKFLSNHCENTHFFLKFAKMRMLKEISEKAQIL